MFWLLRDCGVPAKHLVYNKVGAGQLLWCGVPLRPLLVQLWLPPPRPHTRHIPLVTPRFIKMQVSHGDFVTGWAALPRVGGAAAVGEADLPPHAADLVKLVSGRVAVRYTPPSS